MGLPTAGLFAGFGALTMILGIALSFALNFLTSALNGGSGGASGPGLGVLGPGPFIACAFWIGGSISLWVGAGLIMCGKHVGGNFGGVLGISFDLLGLSTLCFMGGSTPGIIAGILGISGAVGGLFMSCSKQRAPWASMAGIAFNFGFFLITMAVFFFSIGSSAIIIAFAIIVLVNGLIGVGTGLKTWQAGEAGSDSMELGPV